MGDHAEVYQQAWCIMHLGLFIAYTLILAHPDFTKRPKIALATERRPWGFPSAAEREENDTVYKFEQGYKSV